MIISEIWCLASPIRVHLWPGLKVLRDIKHAAYVARFEKEVLIILDGVMADWNYSNVRMIAGCQGMKRISVWVLTDNLEAMKNIQHKWDCLLSWTVDYNRNENSRQLLADLWRMYGQPSPLLVEYQKKYWIH